MVNYLRTNHAGIGETLRLFYNCQYQLFFYRLQFNKQKEKTLDELIINCESIKKQILNKFPGARFLLLAVEYNKLQFMVTHLERHQLPIKCHEIDVALSNCL